MRFLIDMPLSPNLAAWLRDNGHDAVHASELGMHRASDLEILMRAKRDHRTIITADLDYPRLLVIARAAEPSLILFRDGDWGEADVIARMQDLLRTLSATDIMESVIVIDHQRVRRRKFPLTRK